MNFGREQSLLRQRLTAVGSPTAAAARQQELGGEVTSLGAPDSEVRAAALALVETYPQMGRAQMTAFVRTLWASKIHELRAVGVEILAARAALLEPADLPFLEKLLGDETAAPLVGPLADGALGDLVARNKKLWKDLERFVKSGRKLLRRAAAAAVRQAVAADAALFARFEKLVQPLLADADAATNHELDRVLTALAATNHDAVRDYADRHGRKLKLPRPPAKKAAAAKVLPAARPLKKAAIKKPAIKKAAKKAAKKTTRK
ncbi:MAG: DNA alkylation repair protein [Planctomycetes bacterium]|nr:DNA alkylation repair protein [Planctomycetota bacterium]